MSIKYVRGYHDPHKGLRLWSHMARDVKGVKLIRVPMHIPSFVGFLGKGNLLTGIFKIYAHILLICRIYANASKVVIVREFLTLPLLLISPFLFFCRARVRFVCQHNIAHANRKITHKISLRFLRVLGFHFVLFENTSAWRIIEPNMTSLQNIRSIALPMPFDINFVEMKTEVKFITIGFIGNFRKEKSPTWAINALLNEVSDHGVLSNCKLLVGSPDGKFLSSFSDSIEIVNTYLYSTYINTLKSCDVVVLPYESEAYSYRSSGVLAEAVACGCAVVIPNLPILREQVLYPATVGACYGDRSEFVGAVQTAVTLVREGKLVDAIREHEKFRGPNGVRKFFEKLANDAA